MLFRNRHNSASDLAAASAGRALCALFGLSMAIAGCGSESPPVGEGSAALPTTRDAAREALEDHLEATYQAWFDSQLTQAPVEAVLRSSEFAKLLKRERTLLRLYEARKGAPFLTSESGLTPVGQSVVDAVALSADHGLDPKSYHQVEISEALTSLTEWDAGLRHAPPFGFERALKQALVAATDVPSVASAPNVAMAALTAVLGDAATSTAPEYARAHAARLELARGARGARATLEALLADALLDYGSDQGLGNAATLDDPKETAARAKVVEGRLAKLFDDAAAAQSSEVANALVSSLPPRHDQYGKLLEVRKLYAAVVAKGGWPKVTAFTGSRGTHGPQVATLKVRLSEEGYAVGPLDDRFDEPLGKAVSDYMVGHQLDPKRGLYKELFSSLNVTAEQRLKQLDLTLQRWRESRIGDDPDFAFVNIPDFHAEVWRDGKRAMRFRIVVGNTTRECDPETKSWKYANATPLQSARMSYITLNPFWNVPQRIVNEELLPELLEAEDYFEKKGIEKVMIKGEEVVRQKPGEDNALGLVKFMFPNPHSTYMHDTNKKAFFAYPVRAFSHGCMRVQDPMKLLEHMLTEDGQYDAAKIDKIYDDNKKLEEKKETTITLKTAVPVHVEYYVVRVNDEGQAEFLSDIYKYDRDRMTPPSAESLRCVPKEEAEHELVLGEDNKVMLRDKAGTLTDPKAAEAPLPAAEPVADPASPAAGDLGP
jgi:murein L,D-transpeptidase YcbB/YkuD